MESRKERGSGMRWCILLAVLGLSVAREASFAERPPGDERPSRGSHDSAVAEYPDSGYFASAGVVQFQLIQGRLRLDAPRHRKGSQNREVGPFFESITVTACRGVPSLHYVYQAPRQRLTLSVQHATHVRVESQCPETGQRAVLDQQESGPVSLTVSQGPEQRTHAGSTLLHVRLDDPVGFDRHFGVLIGRLLRGRTLQQLSQSTEKILLQRAVGRYQFDVEAVHVCLRKLRSSKASTRRKAEKELLALGSSILPILDSIQPDDLDAEQLDRIRKLRRKLRPQEDDTPRSLAMLLLNDREHWARLSTRLSTEQMQLANVHLARVGLESLPLVSDPVVRIAAGPVSQ